MPRASSTRLRQQEPVGRDQIDLRDGSASCESSACRTREIVLFPTATLPAMPITNGTRGLSEPTNVAVALMQVLRRADVQIQQPRQRQVDVGHFVERHPLVEADERTQLRLGQRQRRRRAQARPLGARELDEPREGHLIAWTGRHPSTVLGVS